MRRFPVLLVAAVAALAPIPAASAHEPPPSNEAPEACLPPDVVAQYHPDRMLLQVTLPATGCPTRENQPFSLSAWVDRTEHPWTEGYGQVVGCGPFPASDAAGRTQDRVDVCELDMELSHPSPEAAYYDIWVTFPGVDGAERFGSHSFCRTGPDGAFCTDADER